MSKGIKMQHINVIIGLHEALTEAQMDALKARPITAADPRKADIIATFKRFYQAGKITQTREDDHFYYAKCFRKKNRIYGATGADMWADHGFRKIEKFRNSPPTDDVRTDYVTPTKKEINA